MYSPNRPQDVYDPEAENDTLADRLAGDAYAAAPSRFSAADYAEWRKRPPLSKPGWTYPGAAAPPPAATDLSTPRLGPLAPRQTYPLPTLGRGEDAEAFASRRMHLIGGADLNNARTLAEYTAMRNAMKDVYTLGMTQPGRTIGGPIAATTAGRALDQLRTTTAHIGRSAMGDVHGAATTRDTPTSKADVWVDPFNENVSDNDRRYSPGGQNYVPFHELAHAIWSGLKPGHWRDPNREVIGNAFGGDLARAAGRPYPDFEILPRAKPGPKGWPKS